jgi:hypothetical protein
VSDLAIFPWHLGALLPAVALERMTIEGLTLALVVIRDGGEVDLHLLAKQVRESRRPTSIGHV